MYKDNVYHSYICNETIWLITNFIGYLFSSFLIKTHAHPCTYSLSSIGSFQALHRILDDFIFLKTTFEILDINLDLIALQRKSTIMVSKSFYRYLMSILLHSSQLPFKIRFHQFLLISITLPIRQSCNLVYGEFLWKCRLGYFWCTFANICHLQFYQFL